MDNPQVPQTNPEPIPFGRHHREHRTGLFFPLLLVLVGVFFLLSNLNLVSGDFWELFTTYWPVLMILGGLDGLFRRDGWVGPLFWAGAGVLLLLANLGYFPWDAWYLISRFWPLMVLAIGLDILIGRRGMGGAVIGTLLAIALILGVVWLANITAPATGNLVRQTIDQSLDGATEAKVEITSIGEHLTLSEQNEAGKLITGEIMVRDGDDYRQSYSVLGGKGSYVLKPDNTTFTRPIRSNENATWDIQLNQDIPQDLELDTIFTEGNLDMSQMSDLNLDLENIFSDVTLSLPQDGEVDGTISSIFGRITLIVPRGVALEVDTSGFMMSNVRPDGFQTLDGGKIVSPEAVNGEAAIKINIEQVFGSLVIEYAD